MVRHWTAALAAAAVVCACGCRGNVGIGDTDDGTDPFVANNTTGTNNIANTNGTTGRMLDSFECLDDQVADEVPLRRLSMAQLRYTLRDLLDMVAPNDAAGIWPTVERVLEQLPEDTPTRDGNSKHGGFRRLDQALQQQHVELTLEAATIVANELTQTPTRLAATVGDCATDGDTTNDSTCLDEFVASFGELTHRRPLEAGDLAFYRSVHDSAAIDPLGVRDVIAVMLTAPHFLYHVEHGVDAVPGKPDVVALDAFELASRLSYHFWQSMPDAQLLAAARNGSLLDADVYREQVDRVFADTRTERSIRTFMQEWLWLDELPELNGLVGTNLYDNFAGANSPSPDLREAMVDEVQELGKYYTLTAPGSFDELFTSPYSFARSAELAAIYGVPAWSGSGEPPTFNEPERGGLYTRAAFLATGTANTRPIMKGLFIRQGLLCTVPPPPDDNAAMTEINLQDGMTTREVVEELTEQPGTTCAGCHLNFLNPLGFVTENFDSLGRYRTHQTMFDSEGNITGEREVDTTTSPQVPIGTMHDVSNAAELTPHLIDSGQLYTCFARNYVQFTFSRIEDLQRDGCVLEATRVLLQEGATLPDVLKGLALTAEFQERTMVE